MEKVNLCGTSARNCTQPRGTNLSPTHLGFSIPEHGRRRLRVERAALALVGDDGLEEFRAAVRLSPERAPEKHLREDRKLQLFMLKGLAISLPRHKSG